MFYYKKNNFLVFSLLFLSFFHAELLAPKEKHFVIVTASYNNLRFCMKNLQSIDSQRYNNYNLIYIDDCSNDNMSMLVKSYIFQNNHLRERIIYIHNNERRHALPNQYRAVHM